MIALIDGDHFLHACLWGTNDAKKAIENVEYSLGRARELSFCTEQAIAFKGMYNFRDDLYPAYKQIPSRVTSRKAFIAHGPDVASYIANLPDTVVADNIEADDLLGIWSRQLGKHKCVIVSRDKDLDQLDGFHLNPYVRAEVMYYEVTKEAADKNFLRQLLAGDPVDNIPGLPGIGPVKSAALRDSLSVSELADKVISLYKKAYKDEWYSYLLANGRLLWILRKENEYFSRGVFQRHFDRDLA